LNLPYFIEESPVLAPAENVSRTKDKTHSILSYAQTSSLANSVMLMLHLDNRSS